MENIPVANARANIKYIVFSLFLIVTWYFYSKPSKVIIKEIKQIVHCETPGPPPFATWNPSKNQSRTAIAILFDGAILDLAPSIGVLDQYLSDNLESDIIIFLTMYPVGPHLHAVTLKTKRQITYYNIDAIYTTFPKGFDPYREEPTWSKRGKWNYHHMCRFWFKLIFDIPLINKYEFVMRLDSDSKLVGVWFNVFDFMRNQSAVNFANIEQADTEGILPGLMKLKTFTYEYINKTGIVPKNPVRLARAFDIPFHIRLHNTNFDISKTEFFKSKPVTHWINAVDETYGIFRYRWGDHVLKYLTTAIFATPSEVLLRTDYNLPYCHPC
ncbi:unnamed protein product [Adineta ricciae]|uniref:Uncharacterized protein n=1 Tax=Adineta ricciae TaxID=249248 RepID=A0A815UW48_ADIRI|nr:unnamed protein product [Adineta ricciae]CAF1621739.1 unnamed protein product [Adineta ricciae]